MSRPKYDLLGNTTFATLNVEVNLPKMAGAALLGNDASGTVDFLHSDQVLFQFGPSLDDTKDE